LLTRILSSIIAFPLIAFIVHIGGDALKVLLIAVSIKGMSELYKALNSKYSPENLLSYGAVLAYYFFLDTITADKLIMIIGLYIMLNLVCLVAFHTKITPLNLTNNIFGFFYVGLLLSGIYLVRSHEHGQYFVWLIFISAWACDTFAYFTGKFFGKRKLSPVLSPKKTVEGAIGGTLGAVLTSALFAYAIVQFTSFGYEMNLVLICAIVGGIGAIFAQIGDLGASAIKRYTKIKDYGKIIPGHGGVMDRFDSVLCTAPMVYIVLQILL